MIARLTSSLASRLLPDKTLSIFTFHRIVKAHDSLLPGHPDASRFKDEMVWLKQIFQFLEPEDACDRLFSGRLPERAAMLTLDDGYEENFDVVNPILTELKVPAVYFIATRFLGDKIMFNDRLNEAIRLSSHSEIDLTPVHLGKFKIGSLQEKREALDKIVPVVKYLGLEPREELVRFIESRCEASPHSVRMMNEAQIRATSKMGITIGAHTRNHPILRLLSDEDSRTEIHGSVDDLHALLGQKPTLFAYPNGRYMDDFEDRHCDILSTQVKYAFATGGGVNRKSPHPYRLARLSPWGKTKWGFQMRQIKNMFE
jgi:peptidoglycan/xylan/chitin deacetylase (PgdA/CDA1 family)